MQWNLDQLGCLLAAADSGSFSAAARRLGKAQSAVSTAIAHLELDLGLTLFDRRRRTPVLTAEGEAVVLEAREILRQCDQLAARASALASGEESRLTLAVDEALPYPPLMEALTVLAERWPALELSLLNGAQDDIPSWVADGTADLGVLFSQPTLPETLSVRQIARLSQTAIVAAAHPLAGEREVRLSTLSRHRQLVVASALGGNPLGGAPLGGHRLARLSPRVWQLNSYYAIAELVSQGIGWALVPEHIAAYPMYRSLVSRLAISELPEPASVGVELVRRRAAGQGPIARWLENELSARLSR
ncbi:LysR family transcriptional regulator [Halomonas sp. HP20-15]|uniref:LysR family transcriptional regulator n=1 Tax=Halomonas sp. HP20-15 TaxID=3085901 RepID=UPI002980D9E5|nr:LysR family transcriptional regulator [Halomonas sp. HP20-15]MDW5378476.1 LysR family transcriptional regulator [Halomonas sp. HP20-15]